jgi:hypothetical protein
MISLKRIVEQQGADSQFYDLGRDFANFRRTIDGSFDQTKQKFEQVIGSRLNGKRIRARASRGYKQYVKDYEFDVSKITLDDYYDNYVVVAHDNSTPKPKEYFLKPGFKIQVLGPASGQPTQGGKPEKQQVSPENNPDKAQSQPMAPAAPTSAVPPVKEAAKEDKTAGTGHFDAYPIDTISQDIKGWLPTILRKPGEAVRDFIVGLGWLKDLGRGRSVALFDLKLPLKGVKVPLSTQNLQKLLHSADRHGTIETTYELVKAVPDEVKEEMLVRVKKTMIDKSAI